MKHCDQNCLPAETNEHWLAKSGQRFPDLHNRYKIGWRDALKALLGPAERLHHLRNMRSALFYDAIGKVDRREDCDRSATNGE